MNVSTDEQAALLAIQIKDITSARCVTLDDNPVSPYVYFCKAYNQPCNIVDGKAYEVPDLTSCGYKLYRSLWTWWTVAYRKLFDGPNVGDCCGGIDSDSPCCLCETLFYILCGLYPLALFGLTLASSMIYIIAKSSENLYFSNPKAEYFTAFCVLVPTVVAYLVPVLCFG